jgi:hypothetical protein
MTIDSFINEASFFNILHLDEFEKGERVFYVWEIKWG